MAANPLRAQVSQLIRQQSPPRLSTLIEQSVRDSLVLRPDPRPDDEIPTGKSKLGGMPDLPLDVDWPAWKDHHLSFIAQINLSDLPSVGFLEVLPENGVLSFFYSGEQTDWGFDPHHRGSWRILHLAEHDLHRRTCPPELEEGGIYKSCSLDWELSLTLPALESPHVDLDYEREQWDEIAQYFELMKGFRQLLDEGSCIHRLLGHPDQIQGDMLLEAQLVSHGLYCGDATGYLDPRRKELESGAGDWQLLLQVDSDDSAGMMWGDMGKLYYLMTSEHMRNNDFDGAWLVLQCT